MFRDAIPGMDKVFQTEPPEGSVILIVGNAGTLKSAFTYNLISNDMAHKPNDLTQCIFVTLEETRESLLRNIKNMGIPSSERIQVSDVASFLRAMESWTSHVSDDKDYIGLILEKASRPFKIYPPYDLNPLIYPYDNKPKDKVGAKDDTDTPIMRPRTFVLDSLNAFNSIVYNNSRNIRREMASLMNKLRERAVTSFIVMEVGDLAQHKPEHFLVDGIIELGMVETERHRFKRYMKVRKMRSTRHSIEPFLLEVTGEGIKVVEELI
jgi:KaiC/GvpD/RAD55 family RecA-like ATPase